MSACHQISLDVTYVCSILLAPSVVSKIFSGLKLTVGGPRYGNRKQQVEKSEQQVEARRQKLEAHSANKFRPFHNLSSHFDEHALRCFVQADTMSRDHLDTRGAAAYLRLHHNTLEKWRLIDAGPPYIRLGLKKIRYDPADLDAWRDQRKTRPGEALT